MSKSKKPSCRTKSECQLLNVAMSEINGHMELTNKSLETVAQTLLQLNSKMEGLDHVIRGNGSPGLVAKVALLEQSNASFQEDRKDTKKAQQTAFYGGIGAFLISVISFVLQRVWR